MPPRKRQKVFVLQPHARPCAVGRICNCARLPSPELCCLPSAPPLPKEQKQSEGYKPTAPSRRKEWVKNQLQAKRQQKGV